ncbi:MAG: DUF4403 family protein [Gemmatimonas sp.]|nr:DUF4403 family protein [Gemmatimonas sp.]
MSRVAWMRGGDFVQRLRDGAKFPLDDILERPRQKVEDTLNRDLTDGVRLSGSVTTVTAHPLCRTDTPR